MELDNNHRKQRGKTKEEVIFPLPETALHLPEGYADFIGKLKDRIAQQRIKTVLSANADMVTMYWEIGNSILLRQQNEGWGTKVIDRMSYDLKQSFPDMQGFSPRNLRLVAVEASEP